MSILDLFKLDGQTALVTGCRRGIGRGFAQALAEAGADIVGVSASLEADSEVGKDIAERGKNASQDTLAISATGRQSAPS